MEIDNQEVLVRTHANTIKVNSIQCARSQKCAEYILSEKKEERSLDKTLKIHYFLKKELLSMQPNFLKKTTLINLPQYITIITSVDYILNLKEKLDPKDVRKSPTKLFDFAKCVIKNEPVLFA